MSSLHQNYLRIQSLMGFRRLDLYKKFLKQLIEVQKITEFNIRGYFLFLSNNSSGDFSMGEVFKNCAYS